MSAAPQPDKKKLDPHGLSDTYRAQAQEELAKTFVSIQEIVLAARRTLSPAVWDMLSGGSDSETTLRRNRAALDSLALRQRVPKLKSPTDCILSLKIWSFDIERTPYLDLHALVLNPKEAPAAKIWRQNYFPCSASSSALSMAALLYYVLNFLSLFASMSL